MDEQNVVYLCSEMIYSHKRKVLTHATSWMNLEKIMLSEKSQTQKDIHILFILNIQNWQIHRDIKQMSIGSSWERERLLDGSTQFPLGVMRMFWN